MDNSVCRRLLGKWGMLEIYFDVAADNTNISLFLCKFLHILNSPKFCSATALIAQNTY